MKNNQKLLNIYTIKKNVCVCVCVSMYKRYQISKEACKNRNIEIFDNGKYFWINRRDLEVESDNWVHKYLINVIQKKQKNRQQLIICMK